ncbi:unnamed protein product [Lathyrus sativus]|nr:unnamed protein product [Lathyrus sativus]
MLLTVENPEPVLETFQNHLAAGTLEVLSPVFSDKKNSITNNSIIETNVYVSQGSKSVYILSRLFSTESSIL